MARRSQVRSQLRPACSLGAFVGCPVVLPRLPTVLKHTSGLVDDSELSVDLYSAYLSVYGAKVATSWDGHQRMDGYLGYRGYLAL